jgi:hypothetical protein
MNRMAFATELTERAGREWVFEKVLRELGELRGKTPCFLPVLLRSEDALH